MRLIDEAYLQTHKVHGIINNVEGDFVSGAAIAHAPTVDAESVTRCRNCHNAITVDCVLYCTHWRMNTSDDGYCYEGF